MPDYLKLADIDLIATCLEKDAEAWETLVRRYQRLIASITIKYGLTSDDSSDVFQTVCLALLQQLPNLRKQDKLSSWLITVTVRECWKLRQRGSKVAFLDEEQWERVAETPDQAQRLIEDDLLTIERQLLIRRSVEMLTPSCRQLITGLFYAPEPITYAEISRQLNIPVASIGPTRGRCLAKLKETLKKIGFK